MKRDAYLLAAFVSKLLIAAAATPNAFATDDPPNFPPFEEIAAARPTSPPPTPAPSEPPDSAPLMEHLKLLSEFLELPPEKLENIRKTILVIESLNEEERARLRKKLERVQLDLVNTGDQIGALTADLSPIESKTFKRYWLSLPEPKRTAIEAELTGLDSQKKTEKLREHIKAFSEREARLIETFQSPSKDVR